MKTNSIAVETSRSTSQSDSIVRQTNKRSFLSYTTMNNIHIFNDKDKGEDMPCESFRFTEITDSKSVGLSLRDFRWTAC